MLSQHLGVFGLDEVIDADRRQQDDVIGFEADAPSIEDGALHALRDFRKGGAHVASSTAGPPGTGIQWVNGSCLLPTNSPNVEQIQPGFLMLCQSLSQYWPISVKRRSKGTPDRRRRGTPFSDNMMLVC
ncbi:hypothetical protein [Sphingobium sp. GW456-12-10-14-TSB1]|uniref:hypothetical protein n=1 Tax=Sphingobium sp. GW456-12-10-14-TSB1 TaxID=1987165 RepID=UPI001594DB3E|nr:hypothetical protein [Sphingobium sp. GW456-12-10-14-TSB1]